MAKTYDASLNANHISNSLHAYEAARSGFFALLLPEAEFRNLIRPDIDPDTVKDENGNITDPTALLDSKLATQYIKLNVTRVKLPSHTIAQHNFRRGNHVVKYGGVPTFNDGNIVVDDIVGLDTKSILYAWWYLVYNPINKKGGRMSEYKKDLTLIEYTQDYVPIRTWDLKGCFILNIDEPEFDKENDAPRKLTINLSVDWSEQHLDQSETSIWVQGEIADLEGETTESGE